ncbi:MAG: LysM peptidoglycan-binding domain-containing protein [Desulfovibrio sp.]|nr:LysM peptidoglycan-binding domain-containing protein [Desulfovibrio sp.]
MKNKSLLYALCLCLTIFSCSKEDKQSFTQVDHDKDNGIIFEELAFVYPDILVENFAAYDANQNGILELDEYEAFRQEVVTDKKSPRVAKLAPPQHKTEGAAPRPAASPAVPQPDITVTIEGEKAPSKAAPKDAPASAAKPAPQAGPGVKAQQSREKTGTTSYTIARGDTLTKIAKAHNITVEEILRANEGLSADSIRDGQVITIPKR